MKKRNLFPGIILVLFLGIYSFTIFQYKQDVKSWDIPAKYKAMKNPSPNDDSTIKAGKMLYSKHCKSCHGGLGYGDGPKAASLKTKIRSLDSEEFQVQSDGVIYYQSIIGRDEMPNYEVKIPDEESRWAIVDYIRTFKK